MVGFLILAGAVNTAIIGSNGVLNRVAEDGVLPDWFLKPHPRFGTTYRLLYLIVGLQLVTILLSRGDMSCWARPTPSASSGASSSRPWPWWCCASRTAARASSRCRFNIRIGSVEVPIGLSADLPGPAGHGRLNLFTKEVATVSGVAFTAVFLVLFMVSEHYPREAAQGGRTTSISSSSTEQHGRGDHARSRSGLTKPYRKLVAIRSPHNLFMLEKALAETDPRNDRRRRDDGQGDAAGRAARPSRPTSTATTSS